MEVRGKYGGPVRGGGGWGARTWWVAVKWSVRSQVTARLEGPDRSRIFSIASDNHWSIETELGEQFSVGLERVRTGYTVLL